MQEVAAVSSLALTVTLVLSRPRLWAHFRVGPALAALAGVLVMLAAGDVHVSDAGTAVEVLWKPLVAIASIMATTAAALRLGAVDRLASSAFAQANGSSAYLFAIVFALSAGTSAVLNNDSAVLLLTPLVVILVRRLFPDRLELIVPFAFAVFMAAGVAPLVTSNPMNLIVADYAGIGFNRYAGTMLPISVVGWIATFLVLRWIFRRELRPPSKPVAAAAVEEKPVGWTAPQWQGLAVVLAVLGAYPIVAYLGGSVWIVAAAGAVVAMLLCQLHRRASLRELLVTGISWEILVFLVGVFIIAIGFRNVGIVDWLAGIYEDVGLVGIGVLSAAGSAVLNNHSMALTNLLALDTVPGAGEEEFLAALIGGDLGPRLLPIGSLAGLLWLASLRRLGIEISLLRFVGIGALVTVPSLVLSLLLLVAS